MNLINFNNCEKDYLRFYAGQSGRKIPIIYEQEQYFLKLPGNLKEKNLKNINLSYSNSPISEYIGSQIYKITGMDVHTTLLGIYTQNGKEKIVCACKDFEQYGGKLYEFGAIKTSFEPSFTDSNGHETNGAGTDIVEIQKTLEEHPTLKVIPGIKERFWNMFVVDALIGNPDRNNGNWGILTYSDKHTEIAPVYDNGNCLNNKWEDERFRECLLDEREMENQSYRARTCIFCYKDKKINPYHYIYKMENPDCNKAVLRMMPRINLKEINKFINDIPCISDVRKQFYQRIMAERFEKILEPTYEVLQERIKTAEKHKMPLKADDLCL